MTAALRWKPCVFIPHSCRSSSSAPLFFVCSLPQHKKSTGRLGIPRTAPILYRCRRRLLLNPGALSTAIVGNKLVSSAHENTGVPENPTHPVLPQYSRHQIRISAGLDLDIFAWTKRKCATCLVSMTATGSLPTLPSPEIHLQIHFLTCRGSRWRSSRRLAKGAS